MRENVISLRLDNEGKMHYSESEYPRDVPMAPLSQDTKVGGIINNKQQFLSWVRFLTSFS